jgi:hypothetical protein
LNRRIAMDFLRDVVRYIAIIIIVIGTPLGWVCNKIGIRMPALAKYEFYQGFVELFIYGCITIIVAAVGAVILLM